MTNRIAIYALYDKNGIIDDYIVFTLQELKKIADKVVVVSNCTLTEESRNKLSFTDACYERGDICYDVGAISDCLVNLMGWDETLKYDELIVMNDSVFGPFYPFGDIMDAMDKRSDLDFWGLVERGESDFDGGIEIYPEHIQLYFYVVRKNMLHSQAFKDYFETITDTITNFRSAIINYEFMFTKHFADLGYKWDVYCYGKNYITDKTEHNLSPYHYESYTLIKDYKCPLLKRKLFTGDFVQQSYCDRNDLAAAFEYIRNETDYDTDLIWHHILRNYHIRDIISAMNLYKVMDNDDNGRCGADYDVVILSDNIGIKEHIPFDPDSNSDLVLVINDPETSDNVYSLIDSRIRNIVLNLAEDPSYISNILDEFKTDPRLGLLVPPAEAFGSTFFSALDKWNNSSEACKRYKELGLTVPFNAEKAPIHGVRAFWCRRELLTEEVLAHLRSNCDTVMRLMPLVAQQYGYYTSVVTNRKYVPVLLKNLYSETENIIRTFCDDIGPENDSKLMIQKIYTDKIRSFCNGKSQIYVYGAGQLAQKIIKLTETIRPIDGVYVTDTNGNSEEVFGYKVRPVSEMKPTDSYGIIVAVGLKNNKTIKKLLNDKNFTELLILS